MKRPIEAFTVKAAVIALVWSIGVADAAPPDTHAAANCTRAWIAADDTATFHVTVDADGRVSDVRPSRQPSTPALDAVSACLREHPERFDWLIASNRRRGTLPVEFDVGLGSMHVEDVEPAEGAAAGASTNS